MKLFATLWTVASLLCPCDSPGKNTGVGSILAWRIPWTQEPGGYDPQSHKESDTTEVTWPAHTAPSTATKRTPGAQMRHRAGHTRATV